MVEKKEQVQEKQTYTVSRVRCYNCGTDNENLKIPMGTMVEGHRCPRCGCYTLEEE